MRRYWAAATVLVLIGVLSSAFYWLEFYAAQSDTRADSQTTTVSSQLELLRTRGNAKLTVFVPGDGALEAALGRELRAELAKSPLFAEVAFQSGRAGTVAGDVLVVDLGRCQMTWTGVYSHADVDASAAYSTAGSVDWRRQEPVQLHFDGPTVVVHEKLTLEDGSRGLMSLNGYSAELGRKLAREIARSLLAELQKQVA